MKKLIFLALLCLGFAAAHAAPLIINKTHCKLEITPVCYDPTTCTFSACGPAIVVPAVSSVPLPPPCGCSVPQLQGYTVCYSGIPACFCANVSDAAGGPCANFPLVGMLNPCDICGPGGPYKIFWNSAGNMVIQ